MSDATSVRARRIIIRDGIAVGVATGVVGISFGAVSTASGLSVLQTSVLSLLMFTGASQFAFVGVVAAGGSLWTGVVTAWLLGLRNAIYGLRLTTLLGYAGWRRWGAAQLIIDESTAMSISRENQDDARTGLLSTGWAVFVCWNLATILGAVAGTSFADPRALGIDAAVGGAFLALLWPRLSALRGRRTAGLAAVAALVTVPLVPPGIPVLIAGAVCVLAALIAPHAFTEESP